MKKLIAQGAESKLYLDKNKIIKNRFKKTYRIKEIDERLRKSRTKREAKVLEKLEKIRFPSPKVIKQDESDIELEYIRGKLLKETLTKTNSDKLAKEIGIKIATLHNNQIIHGDLTTSNMISSKEIYFIDFGLSFFSHKIEDKAVDLHLLKEALESKHHEISEKCYKRILEEYRKKAEKGEEILERVQIVETRGRYKRKNGTAS